jgi:hypothetical protein
MALPTAFANLVNPTGPELDSDLSAVGVIGVMPCTISGSANAIIMTPNTNVPIPAANPAAPTVAAYGNYMRFSGVAGTSNSGATTIQVGALAALPAYKDTEAGPVALTGTEIVQACSFEAVYDSALNSGAGGFHVYCNLAVGGSLISPSQISLQNTASTLTNFNSASVSAISYTVVPATTSQEQLLASGLSNGLSVGDALVARFFAGIPNNAIFMAPYVKAANTIALRVCNPTGASISAFTVSVGFIGLRAVP